MEYYNPNGKQSIVAAIVLIVLLAIFAAGLSFLTISVSHTRQPYEVPMEMDVSGLVDEPEEEPKKKEQKREKVVSNVAKGQEKVTTKDVKTPSPAETKETEEPKANEAKGEDPKMETLNQKAIFNPAEALSTESVATGNKYADEGETETRKGEGSGYTLDGIDQLDAGLRNRGLRDALPKPPKNFNTDGTVAIFVKVNAEGNVAHAEVRMMGSTTQDPVLQKLALDAAWKARFTVSNKGEWSEGIIKYTFITR